uniref:Uncharacterized protein n=1 Tax=Anguilla anguilla TaxID=7936 RepID=A0A0E9X614_ANGAN
MNVILRSFPKLCLPSLINAANNNHFLMNKVACEDILRSSCLKLIIKFYSESASTAHFRAYVEPVRVAANPIASSYVFRLV